MNNLALAFQTSRTVAIGTADQADGRGAGECCVGRLGGERWICACGDRAFQCEAHDDLRALRAIRSRLVSPRGRQRCAQATASALGGCQRRRRAGWEAWCGVPEPFALIGWAPDERCLHHSLGRRVSFRKPRFITGRKYSAAGAGGTVSGSYANSKFWSYHEHFPSAATIMPGASGATPAVEAITVQPLAAGRDRFGRIGIKIGRPDRATTTKRPLRASLCRWRIMGESGRSRLRRRRR